MFHNRFTGISFIKSFKTRTKLFIFLILIVIDIVKRVMEIKLRV